VVVFALLNYIGTKRTALAAKKSSASAIWTNTMTIQPFSSARFAVCVNNSGYPVALELHKIYRVLPDEDAAVDGDVRVVDESGEDYLYPAAYCVPIDVPQAVERSLLKAS
jgi:hypothetical protein